MATKKRKASKKPLHPKKSVKAAMKKPFKTKPAKAVRNIDRIIGGLSPARRAKIEGRARELTKAKSKPKAKAPAPAAPPPSVQMSQALVNLPVEVHGGGLPESFEAVLTAKGAETVIAKLKEPPQ